MASDYRLSRMTPGIGPEEWALAADRVQVVGRRQPGLPAPDVDLAPDRTVSREHARLHYREGSWWLEDCRSRFGTWVGLQRIPSGETVRVREGVSLRLGTSEYAILGPGWHRLHTAETTILLQCVDRYSASLAASGYPLLRQVGVCHDGSPIPRRFRAVLRDVAYTEIDTTALGRAGMSHFYDLPAVLEPGVVAQARRDSLEVSLGDERIDGGVIRCEVLGHADWSYRPEHRRTLTAFVQPTHPVVVDVTRKATLGVSLTDGIDAILGRLYGHLHADWEIDYRKDAALAPSESQRIRTPGEVLWMEDARRGEGTCLDLALVFASCLESLRLQPVLALVDFGASWHALVGCWRKVRRRVDASPQDVELLLEDAVWIDPNCCTRDPTHRATYEDATAAARRQLRDRPLVCALDVAAAREQGVRPVTIAAPSRPRAGERSHRTRIRA